MHGRDEKCMEILVVYLRGKIHSEGLEVDEKIILEWVKVKLSLSFN
jgi:hypothetical protein